MKPYSILFACVLCCCQSNAFVIQSKDFEGQELIKLTKGDKLTLSFPSGILLSDLLMPIESFTNCSFIFDENVAKRKVIIVSNKVISAEEFPAFLRGILEIHHLSLVLVSKRTGENSHVAYKVLSDQEMHSLPHPVVKEGDLGGMPDDYRWATCTFTFKYLKPYEVSNSLINYITSMKGVQVMPSSMTITVTDKIYVLKKIAKYLKEVDVPGK
jgi:hypothetical protein